MDINHTTKFVNMKILELDRADNLVEESDRNVRRK